MLRRARRGIRDGVLDLRDPLGRDVREEDLAALPTALHLLERFPIVFCAARATALPPTPSPAINVVTPKPRLSPTFPGDALQQDVDLASAAVEQPRSTGASAHIAPWNPRDPFASSSGASPIRPSRRSEKRSSETRPTGRSPGIRSSCQPARSPPGRRPCAGRKVHAPSRPPESPRRRPRSSPPARCRRSRSLPLRG
jgi:hypothetical protein